MPPTREGYQALLEEDRGDLIQNGKPLLDGPEDMDDEQVLSHRRIEDLETPSHIHQAENIILEGSELHFASIEQKRRKWWRDAVINVLFILSWFLFATLLSVYNKWMFSPEYLAFPFPLFVTSLHMVVQFLMAAVCRYAWPERFKPDRNPTPENYVKRAVPTAMATSFDIGLSNLSLKLITLSFYTMCKSSSLIFVLIFAFLLRLETFSIRLVLVILLITSGVILMVYTSTTISIPGLFLVLSASAFGGLRWSLTQLLLRKKENGMGNPAATIFWLAPAMGLTLIITSAIFEGLGNVIRSKFFDGQWVAIKTIGYLVAPGTLAFAMVMSEYYIIKRAGVIPLSIAGIFKEVTTISVSAWVFGDKLTPLNITGVGITVCGIALFTYHKYRVALESTVPLDAHGNPLPREEAEEILQEARLSFALESEPGPVRLEDQHGHEEQRLVQDHERRHPYDAG